MKKSSRAALCNAHRAQAFSYSIYISIYKGNEHVNIAAEEIRKIQNMALQKQETKYFIYIHSLFICL